VKVYSIGVRWGECEWRINRRYSQFVELDSALRKTAPMVTLPYPLPPKQAFGRLEESFVNERESALARYVEGIDSQQEAFFAIPKAKHILMRFFAPIQLGDTQPSTPLPFNVADLL
jgi:hypothetical protein